MSSPSASVSRSTFHPIVIVWALLLVASFPEAMRAQEESLVSQFIGSWEGRGKLFGADATFKMRWEWVLGGKFLKLTFRNAMATPDGGERSMEAEAYYKQKGADGFVGTWFDTRGVVQPLRAIIEDSMLTTDWGSDETERGRTVYRLVGRDMIEVQDFVLKGNVWKNFGTAQYTLLEEER